MKQISRFGLYLAWFVSLAATTGSLWFSEVLKFPPCVLCWYQRIAMYPLVIILAVGLVRRSRDLIWYALPLSLIGWIISVYHNLLYFKLLPESVAPCLAGVSCTTRYIEFFGFITIPFLSFLAFSFINISLIYYIWDQKRHATGS